jgi:hypothetical protein
MTTPLPVRMEIDDIDQKMELFHRKEKEEKMERRRKRKARSEADPNATETESDASGDEGAHPGNKEAMIELAQPQVISPPLPHLEEGSQPSAKKRTKSKYACKLVNVSLSVHPCGNDTSSTILPYEHGCDEDKVYCVRGNEFYPVFEEDIARIRMVERHGFCPDIQSIEFPTQLILRKSQSIAPNMYRIVDHIAHRYGARAFEKQNLFDTRPCLLLAFGCVVKTIPREQHVTTPNHPPSLPVLTAEEAFVSAKRRKRVHAFRRRLFVDE